MELETALTLIEARGLSGEAAHVLVAQGSAEGHALDFGSAAAKRRALQQLRAQGFWKGEAVAWPEPKDVQRLAGLMQRAGVEVAWRGTPPYPEKFMDRLGEDAPAWLLYAGDIARCTAATCAVIGSRQSPPKLLEAARRLAQGLAEAGTVVVSGLAEGADQAALEGALRAGPAGAGSVAIPARGLLQIDLSQAQATGRDPEFRIQKPEDRNRSQVRTLGKKVGEFDTGESDEGRGLVSFLGVGRPLAHFNAGLAIRRNSLIAAPEGLVLVASGLTGGSSYALRWAMEHGLPVWALEAGRATPAGNAALIRSGRAEPLALGDSVEVWLEQIERGLRQAALPKRRAREMSNQLDWLVTSRAE